MSGFRPPGPVLVSTILLMILSWILIANFDYFLKLAIKLQPNSTLHSMWQKTPVPILFKIYFFNCTNCDRVASDWNVKPELVQCGPYVYEERHTKLNEHWIENDSFVRFQQKREWFFRADLTNGSMSDRILSLNVVPVTVGFMVRNRSRLQKLSVNFILEREEEMFVAKSVRELIFDGYEDKMLKFLKTLNVSQVKSERFAWFIMRNDSSWFDGNFTMGTHGADFGLLRSWNGLETVPYYRGECARVRNTSTGELYPISRTQSVRIFVSDICSNLQLDRQSIELVDGIASTKYEPRSDIFNSSYCADANGPELHAGVRNISECKLAPAFISFPHFYNAAPAYRSAVNGMQPDADKHRMQLFLEAITKIPVAVSARLQINLLVQPIEHMDYFNNVTKPIFFPMLWFEQEVHLTKPYRTYLQLAQYSILGLLVLLPNLLFVGAFARHLFCRPKTRPAPQTTDENCQQALMGNEIFWVND